MAYDQKGLEAVARQQRDGGAEFDPEVHCYECGSAEKWEHAALFGGLQNCKRCLVKNGGCYGVVVDFDRLVEVVGLEKAKEVLAAGVSTSGVVY